MQVEAHDMIIAGSHDAVLVLLSILVAVVTSYTALDLAGRVRVARGNSRLGWLATAAFALGGGIWSMHFVAMLAFSMPGMDVSYEPGLTVLSLAVAIAAAGAGFLIVALAHRSRPAALSTAGVVTGLGIAGMHYIGMAAMRMQATLTYERFWVAISICIAIGAATVALHLSGRTSSLLERLGAALVMGAAIAGMHYAAMRGSVFHAEPGLDMAAGRSGIGQGRLAVGVAGSTFLVLFLAWIAARFDRRYAETQRRLQEDLRTAYDKQSFLLTLGDRTRVLDDASVIMQETSEAMGRFLDVDRAGFYRIDAPDLMDFDGGACWTKNLPALTGKVAIAAFGRPPATPSTIVQGDARHPPRAAASATREAAADVAAALGVPQFETAVWRGGFYCHQATPRIWTDQEIALVEAVAAQAWDSIRRADARGALQRLNAELEGRVSRQTLDIRLITDALPVLIAFVDQSYTYHFANRAYEDWFYVKAEDVIGRTMPALIGEAEFALRRPHIDRALAGEETRFELAWPHRDGRPRIAEIRYIPRRRPGGPIDGFYIFVIDITERVEAADRLRQMNARLEDEIRVQEGLTDELARRTLDAEAANRAKSAFMANMSHELRTPLSAIIGYAEMLAEDIADGAASNDMTVRDLASDVAKIETSARHLLSLINDVLDLSKVESGKMEAFVETFDLHDMVCDVVATVASLVAKKDNRLVVDVGQDPSTLGMMQSDITRVRQILLNLLGNATKFTENGTIRLRVERAEPNLVRFQVEDTGIGMTEDQVGQLFQRFQQADASTTRQFGGTGLGLALTKAFVVLLGGQIDVVSRHGQGSTFTVTLPSCFAARQDTATDAVETPMPEERRRDVVLVIDDDATQRDLISRFLQREGYAARTAADGRTGLDLARRLRPLAILLDVTMPGMDGWSVLSKLKADPDLGAIPVVMVTFHAERGLAAALGAADYLLKPVDWTRLRHVMNGFRIAEGRVLVVDDEEAMRRMARQALEKNGWTVVEATNGAEALEEVARSIPRVILLDLNMPVMDGFAFLPALRARPGCDRIPVIVLTARDLDAEDRRRLRGANQVLNKGDIRMSELADRLCRIGRAAEAEL